MSSGKFSDKLTDSEAIEKWKAPGGSAFDRLPLLDSGLESMTPEKFKKMYEGEFKQDPLLQYAVEFLRTAKFKEISQARREGWLTQELHRDAKRILERQ